MPGEVTDEQSREQLLLMLDRFVRGVRTGEIEFLAITAQTSKGACINWRRGVKPTADTVLGMQRLAADTADAHFEDRLSPDGGPPGPTAG